ncbi:MAG: tetratricopeptide repeat protein [Acidobacteria bacterium]|nr:tetratricopeptide repeat protein [Acidobacteriota bacterium]
MGALPAAEGPAAKSYRLDGAIEPERQASVTVFGATTPFTTSTLTGADGRFSIKKLPAGTYTLSVCVPGSGEARQTIEVGPGTADKRGRVRVAMRIRDADWNRDPVRRQHAVSARQLAIPESAEREYAAAQKDLEKRDTASAVRHLERAVEIAPGFATAWNNLGTVSYQTRNFARAEECFREALRQDPAAYEPLVNLGGVLLNLNKLDEALELNVHAVLVRPNDALANSQLGMAYFEAGNFDAAIKYLERARKIDPAHFSHPQIYLAEIHLRRGEMRAAAEDLEDFVEHHPDYPEAAKLREKIAEWRK